VPLTIEPILVAVLAPPMFNVVATVLYKFCVVCVPRTVGLPIVIVPEVAPMFNVDATPPISRVVALVLNIAPLIL
jgi:hypothetical protein